MHVVSAADVDQYQGVIDGLTTVAQANVLTLVTAIDTPNPVEYRDTMLAAFPEVLDPFLVAADDVAAEWYTTVRQDAGLIGTYAAVTAEATTKERFDALVRYALTPVFAGRDDAKALLFSTLAGGTQKLIANQGRATIEANVFRDPVRVGYARIPQSGCCAFCGLLASRGPVYSNAEAAGVVIGRGMDESGTLNPDGSRRRGAQAKGVKARGSRGLGNRYHDFCRCVPTPVFPGADNSLIVDTAAQYLDMYRDTGGSDLKTILQSWRKEHGAR